MLVVFKLVVRVVEWGRQVVLFLSGDTALTSMGSKMESYEDLNKFAFVLYFGPMKKFEVVDAKRLYVLSGNRRRHYDHRTDEAQAKNLSVAATDSAGKTLTRCHVLLTGASADDVRAELNLAKAQNIRLSCPPRKSIGPITFPVEDFLMEEERQAAKNKLKSYNSAKLKAKNDKHSNIVKRSLFKKPQHSSTPIKCKDNGKRSPKKNKCTVENNNAPGIKHTEEAAPKADIVLEEPPTVTHGSGNGNISTDAIKTSADMTSGNQLKSLSTELSTGIPTAGSNNGHASKSSKTSSHDITPLESQLKSLSTELAEKVENDKLIHSKILDNLKDISSKLDLISGGEHSRRQKNKCAIQSLETLVSEAAVNPIPHDKVYIGGDRYIAKKSMVDTEKLTTYKARLRKALELILVHPESYNLTGADGMKKVSEQQVEATKNFLQALNWKSFNLKPMKVGKKVFQPHTDDFVRRSMSKYLCEISIKPKKTKKDSDSENEEDEDGRKRKKNRVDREIDDEEDEEVETRKKAKKRNEIDDEEDEEEEIRKRAKNNSDNENSDDGDNQDITISSDCSFLK